MCDACVTFNGRTYHKRGDYYVTHVRLHHAVWEAAHGLIPPGHHIHHINGNKQDNRLENLELLTHGEHSARHYQEKLGPHRERALANSQAAMARNREIRARRGLTCVICGAEYHSSAVHPTRYCSTKCIERARGNVFTGEPRLCEYCATPYQATKRTQRYCAELCNSRANEVYRRTAVLRDLACAECGTAFQSKRRNARFCCHECALTFHDKHRRRGTLKDAA